MKELVADCIRGIPVAVQFISISAKIMQGWARNVARMGDGRVAYRILVTRDD